MSGSNSYQGLPVPEVPFLADAIVSATALLAENIPMRPKVLGEWLREGDYGFVFAPRGHGKSWLSMLMGSAISQGDSLGKWDSGEGARRVVYFDAEMNLADVQVRAKLIDIDSENFDWLQHEKVFPLIKRSLNIAERPDQEAISEMLNDGDVFIIDNLSTATSGIEENNGDHFDLIKGWLLELRHRRITVIMVHHAGRNGQMRGTSKREDMAHWILSLVNDSNDGETAFTTSFVKCRNCSASDAPALRWTIETEAGRLSITCEVHAGKDSMVALVRDGLTSASELAEELGVSKGCVSKWARSLVNESPPRLKIEGRKYSVPDGF